MEHVSNIVITGDEVSFDLDTTDETWVNLLKRSFYQIQTVAIGYVVFNKNNGPREDHILAHRLGLCPIDNTQLDMTPLADKPKLLAQTGVLKVTGPRSVTTDDIRGIPFAHRQPLVELGPGETLDLVCLLEIGNGFEHAKWLPSAAFRMRKFAGGYRVTFDTLGMLPGEQIVEQAIGSMRQAAETPAINRFFNPLIPSDI